MFCAVLPKSWLFWFDCLTVFEQNSIGLTLFSLCGSMLLLFAVTIRSLSIREATIAPFLVLRGTGKVPLTRYKDNMA